MMTYYLRFATAAEAEMAVTLLQWRDADGNLDLPDGWSWVTLGPIKYRPKGDTALPFKFDARHHVNLHTRADEACPAVLESFRIKAPKSPRRQLGVTVPQSEIGES